MIEFLLAGQNLPFSVALGVMVAIGLLEGVAAMVGLGVSGVLDSMLPDLDLPDADLDLDLDADADFDLHVDGGLTKLLGWLHVGRVPVLVLFIIFLTSFGLCGLALQWFAETSFGVMLPSLVACVPAFFAALPCVRVTGGLIAKIIPKDETSAVSEDSFVGRVAILTLGTARRSEPAQAKLKDQHGQTHYVMVEPDETEEEFEAGTHVLLVKRNGSVFQAIKNTSDALVDG
ncbi:MAG: YqiJ family protein [Bdellovibrionales bacterium]|nr:YqiJ family protein [Bdellovibrionales bacterium]